MKIPLVYIASPSYSGSTLLTFLLGAHPDIGTVGELKWGEIDLETYRCSCGELLRECPFWTTVAERMAARGLPFDLRRPATDFRCRGNRVADRLVRARVRHGLFEAARDALIGVWPTWRRTRPTVAAVNRALIEITLDLQQARVFVDSSKDPVRLKYLAATGDYDLRVIHLLRDGRAVTNSSIKNKTEPADLAAREWARTHRQIERLGRYLGPGRLRRVRYEDLCAEPRTVLDDVFRFLGLGPFDAVAALDTAPHHILGNRMRLGNRSAVRLNEEWRTALSEADWATFDRLAGTANRLYGYA